LSKERVEPEGEARSPKEGSKPGYSLKLKKENVNTGGTDQGRGAEGIE
jgi:hypothetical protein